MVVKSRRTEHTDGTRRAIVEAAILRFAADGFTATSVDAVAEAARVTKGAVYHHFKDKAALFEAALVVMDQRLLERVIAATAGREDPWEIITIGIDLFLAECCEETFATIALREAPAALGWLRWKEIEEAYFLGLVSGALDALARNGSVELPHGDMTARMFLAALDEAGLAVSNSATPRAACESARRVALRFLRGLEAGTA